MLSQPTAVEAARVRGAGPLLAYEVVGPRDVEPSDLTLRCMHGNSSHRGIWRLVARQLGDYRCVLLDLRGHGDSEHVAPPAYDPAHHAGDVAQVIAGLALERYAILGHSAGALAAARFIVDVQGATGVAAPAAFVWVDIDPLVPRWQVDYFRQRVSAMARVYKSVEDVIDGFRRMYPDVAAERLRSFVIEGMHQVDDGWRMKLDPATYATWEPGDLRADVAKIVLPTLVLRGAASRGSSAAGAQMLRAALPNGTLREFDGASHLLLLEQPELIATTISEFLHRAV